jgi:hypothetical protein
LPTNDFITNDFWFKYKLFYIFYIFIWWYIF